ncbi:MAG: MarR family transcriptional regulator [Hyphomicrobiales bacterium]|nr:MarR family transcriptional regulator [Hyphomicrobiales bacterium]MBV9115387.1 MarR family transcriptional regulator [Hyphomicrobiales bacterium]MBV9520973.1 MarR family transcriptional regulator [Hyphomicrobiales bacterium]
MIKALETDVLFLLYDVARLMRTRADQRARRHGMTRAQWVILSWLERQSGISQSDLAGLVEVEPITVCRLVDRLEARGLVERRPDPKDRRIKRLHLTSKAKPVLDEIHDWREELRHEVTAGISDTALKSQVDTLLRMKTNLVQSPVLAQVG